MIIRNLIRLILLVPIILLSLSPSPSSAAEPVINLRCSQSACTSDLDVSADVQIVWAPGLGFERTIKVFNDSPTEKVITVGTNKQVLQSLPDNYVEAVWKNGSHKVIWQGPLRDLRAVELGSIPRNQSRIYYFEVNILQANFGQNNQAKISFQPWLTVADAPSSSTTGAASSSNPSNPSPSSNSSPSSSLLPASLLSFALPSLSPIEVLGQMVFAPAGQSASEALSSMRNHAWLLWAILAAEMATIALLGPQKRLELGLLGLISALSVWMVTGNELLIAVSALLPLVHLIPLIRRRLA